MSKYSKLDCKKQIPLKYNDKIRVSNRNWTRIEVTIKQNVAQFIEISGEFPTYISSISKDEKLQGVDVKVGDNIMVINGQNVCRASAKSVKKILKSSTVITMTLSRPDQFSLNKLLSSGTQTKQTRLNSFLNIFKKNINCVNFGFVKEPREFNKNIYVEESVNYCYTIETQSSQVQKIDEISDCGYYSIPRTVTPAASSVSSTSDLGSNFSTEMLKDEINEFLTQIQNAIENYVRPSIMLKVLTIEQSLSLFQNIEKLIPVTKFLDNIVNSLDENSINTSIKIVFDTFKVYLNGLPNAINLLEELACSNDKFVKFIDNIGEVCSFKIMDVLFLPLKFIKTVIDYLKQFDSNESQMMSEMVLCIRKTYSILEEKCDSSINSITQVSGCNDFYTSDFESESESGILSVMVKMEESNEWIEAELHMDKNRIDFIDTDFSIDLNQVINTKQSKSEYIFFVQTLSQQYFALKFHSEILRDLIFDKICKISQKI